MNKKNKKRIVRVGLLTLHPQVYNYGGFLQELALQDAICDLGLQCEIINYDPANELNTFSAKRNIFLLTPDKVIGKIRHVFKKREVSPVVQSTVDTRKRAFDTYRAQVLHMSQPVSYEELRNTRLPYDAIVCGSDQIWNPDYNIPAFFLDFVKEDQEKVIYAASMGKSHLTVHQKKVYGALMQGLEYISVREKSAQEILSPLTRAPIKVVLDPTLLHTKEYWCGKASVSRKEYGDYIFCYFLDLTREKADAARRYAQKRNKKIVMIPYLHGYAEPLCEELADILDSDVSPADFLSLILHADYVLTDSFHATVFSLIFQKNFWVFSRNAGSYNMNTRLDTLLSYYGMENRMISPKELDAADEPCVYSEHNMIGKMREHSLQYLREALGLQ